ncbi:MAG: hypothetical protein WC755_02835 [Candidatus Woesearchaeota archaeon]|jgi:hypothetical protein
MADDFAARIQRIKEAREVQQKKSEVSGEKTVSVPNELKPKELKSNEIKLNEIEKNENKKETVLNKLEDTIEKEMPSIEKLKFDETKSEMKTKESKLQIKTEDVKIQNTKEDKSDEETVSISDVMATQKQILSVTQDFVNSVNSRLSKIEKEITVEVKDGKKQKEISLETVSKKEIANCEDVSFEINKIREKLNNFDVSSDDYDTLYQRISELEERFDMIKEVLEFIPNESFASNFSVLSPISSSGAFLNPSLLVIDKMMSSLDSRIVLLENKFNELTEIVLVISKRLK